MISRNYFIIGSGKFQKLYINSVGISDQIAVCRIPRSGYLRQNSPTGFKGVIIFKLSFSTVPIVTFAGTKHIAPLVGKLTSSIQHYIAGMVRVHHYACLSVRLSDIAFKSSYLHEIFHVKTKRRFYQGDRYLWPYCCMNNLYISHRPLYAQT